MTSNWLTLATGLPSIIMENNAPDAESFLRTLFHNLCQADVSHCEVVAEEQDGLRSIIRGRCGTPELGYDWKRTQYQDDSSEDLMQIITRGLPDIQLRWS